MKITPSFECSHDEYAMLAQYLNEQNVPFDAIETSRVVYVDSNRELTKKQWKHIVNNIM